MNRINGQPAPAPPPRMRMRMPVHVAYDDELLGTIDMQRATRCPGCNKILFSGALGRGSAIEVLCRTCDMFVDIIAAR